jgi:hypothetical protein
MSEKKNKACASHIENEAKICLSGSVSILSEQNENYYIILQCHGFLPDKNRYILGRIINCVSSVVPLTGHVENDHSTCTVVNCGFRTSLAIVRAMF